MNNIDPIQEELAQAGEASPITPELILLDQKSRITSESEIEDEEFLFRFMGEKCFPRKDLTTITGPAKGGKTFFSSLLMACSTKEAEGTLLHMERISQEPLKVMWYDTEQSKHTDYLPVAIDAYRPDIVIVDGIADLIHDINDGPASSDLMEKFLKMANTFNCNIVLVIHLNRSGEKSNLRGWLGSVMLQKSYEVFNCTKVLQTKILSVEMSTSRNTNLEEKLYYTVNNQGIPVVTEKPDIHQKDKRPLRPRCHRHAPSMSYPPSIHALPSIKREGYSMRGCSY